MNSNSTGTHDSQPHKCLWMRPVRQPFIGSRSEVLVYISPDPLPLATTCCRCGAKTGQPFAIKVEKIQSEEAAMSAAELLTGVVGHILFAARELTRQKVLVPCCASCRLLHRFGFFAGIALIIIGLGPFCILLMQDQDTKLHSPVWHVAALIGSTLLLIFMGITIASWFTRNAVPVVVYCTKDKNFYYELWSPIYQKIFLNAVISPPANR